MPEELAAKIDSIHSRLFACYTMVKLGQQPDLDVFHDALYDLEALCTDLTPDELAEMHALN